MNFKHRQMKKSRAIQLEEGQILWTLNALYVVLKFHMGMHDSIHWQVEELFRGNGLHEIKRLVWRILVVYSLVARDVIIF